MQELLEYLGGVYGWCWFRLYEYKVRYVEGWAFHERVPIRDYAYTFKYWPAADNKFYPWILSRRPIIILAGYMSRNRGLHWDRKRR